MAADLKVAIAGHGVVGQRRQDFISQNRHAKVVAICDRNYSGQEGVRDGIAYYANYQRMLEQQYDVLFVCVPNFLAPEITMAGLEHGCHVFCEKPPARSVRDLVPVIATERRRPAQKLKYGFNHRYHGSVMAALDGMRSGRLASLLSLDGIYGKSAIIVWPHQPGTPVAWRGERAQAGGGILLDQGIHMVDLMHSFAGELDVQFSKVSNARWKLDVEDEVRALMTNNKGVSVGLLSSANLHDHTFSLRVVLEGGEYQLSGILSSTRSYGEELLTTIVPRENGGGHPDKQTRAFVRDKSWSLEIAEFMEAVLNDKPITIGHSGEALRTLATVERIYWSDPVWRATFGIEYPGIPDDIRDFVELRARRTNRFVRLLKLGGVVMAGRPIRREREGTRIDPTRVR